MTGPKTAAGTTQSNVNLRLVDAIGKNIVGLKYQVRELEKIVARGATDAEGKMAPFVSPLGTILGVFVEKFDTQEMKLVRKIIPWSEDFTMKLASGKRKDKLTAMKDEGEPGAYKRKTYLVKEGDTLSGIAPRFGTNAVELARLNNISLSGILHIGQVLKVPNGPDGKPAASVAAPAPAPVAAPAPAPAAPPADLKQQQKATPNDPGKDAEPVPAAVQPVTKPVPIETKEERGENGTPKTSVSPVCDQSGCIKLGDKGQLVEEINLRLMGFGRTVQSPAPLDEFTIATQSAVKQFQRDYMGVAETGKVCGKVLAAIDEFKRKHPLPFNSAACQCRANASGAVEQCCTGFGLARTGSESVGHYKYTKNVPAVERPGIHRGLYWSLRAAIFYLHEKESQLGYKFSSISSGYRCWKRAKQMHLFTFNHHGDALDVHFKHVNNGQNVSDNELESLKVKVFVNKLGAFHGWASTPRMQLEPIEGARSWIHMDVTKFMLQHKLDRFYAKTIEAAEGDDLVTMAKREARFGLINCGGIAPGSTVPTQSPVKSPPPAAAPAGIAPTKPAATPAPHPAAPAAKAKGATAGPPSSERQNAQTMSVSQLGLDFIRTWESGNLTTRHPLPYNDNEGFCTVGVGHLIEGKNSCEALKKAGGYKYKMYEQGIDGQQEDDLFAADVRTVCIAAKPGIQALLHQHEFDALMALAFNCGKLTGFTKLLAKLNTGNYSGCCDEFADITNGGNKGLVNRRKSEMKIFRNNVYDATH